METTKIDIAIIGGGIVGLWCAYEFLQKKPHMSVVVFEKENYLGEHTTGRNSEVLHAGIYYNHNSQKHLMCLEGNRLWREFCARHSLTFLDCGKYIVAENSDSEKLEKIYLKAKANSVPKIRRATSAEIVELKKSVRADEAFFSETSAVLDTSSALSLLTSLIEAQGGIVLTNSKIEHLEKLPEGFLLICNGDKIESDILINSAGLFAVETRMKLGLEDYSNRYVKGNYLKLTKKLPLNKLIYPVPPDHGLGLGVHLTLDNQGDQKFGPNTEEVETVNYHISENLIQELYPSIKSVFYTVKENDLQLGYAGIRPKVHDKNNKLVSDFVINTEKEHLIKNYYELLGIESPGLTSAPAIAKKVTNLIFH